MSGDPWTWLFGRRINRWRTIARATALRALPSARWRDRKHCSQRSGTTVVHLEFKNIRRRRPWVVVALCAVLVVVTAYPLTSRGSEPPPGAAASEASLLATVGDGFEIKSTAHFLIAHDGDSETLRDFIARVEATYRGVFRFLNIYKLDVAEPKEKMDILFFEHPESFFDYAQRTGADVRGAAGFYSPRTNRAAFFNALNMTQLEDVNNQIASIETALGQRRGSNGSGSRKVMLKQLRLLRTERDRTIESVNQLVVQHEVAHQVLYNAGIHRRGGDHPTWLVEGLACLFETPPNKNGAGFATVNQYRLLGLREAIQGEPTPSKVRAESYEEALRTGRLVPLRRLIGDKGLFQTSRANVENAYAQAWSLVYYLHRRKRTEFGDYLALLAKRPINREYSAATELLLFEEVFGTIDEAFAQEWLEFCISLRAKRIR